MEADGGGDKLTHITQCGDGSTIILKGRDLWAGMCPGNVGGNLSIFQERGGSLKGTGIGSNEKT